MKIKLCYILLILFAFQTRAQENSWLYRVNRYDFIRYDLNELHHFYNKQRQLSLPSDFEEYLRTENKLTQHKE